VQVFNCKFQYPGVMTLPNSPLSDPALKALRVSESRYRRLFETAKDGILILNADTAQIDDVNPYLIEMLGYTHAEFLGKKLWEVGSFADIAQSKEMFEELQTKGYVRYKDLPLKTKAGAEVAVEFVSNTYACEGVKVIQCNIRNISERKADHAKILRHTQLYAALSQCNKAIVHSTSEEELFLLVCRIAVQFGGMKMAWVGMIDTATQMVLPVASFGDDSGYLNDLNISVEADSSFGHSPTGTAIRENKPFWCQDFLNDPVTVLWHKRTAQAGLAASASLPLYRNGSAIGAFTLYSSGADSIGDLLLIEVTSRLQTSVREGDTVARMGGDDFVVILEELSEEAAQAVIQSEAIAEKIRAAIRLPYELKDYEYHCSASIGISLFRNLEISVDELLKRADTAMYQAKDAGRDTLRFYDADMQAALEDRAALEKDLHSAISENQFRLYYQMQVDHGGHVRGAEGLIRWLHPQRGLVSPVQFIPLAETTGLILLIGQWVLETACVQLKAWEANPHTRDLQLAVNVSARQFRQPHFVEQVQQTLGRHEIDPDRLKLELTESLVLDNINDTIVKMQALKQVGVHFSMDDFGTGNSSLAYLTQLPLDQLKIDQSFVRNISVKPNDAVIVQTIIGMANNLGMEVIAEGVETEEQRVFLEQHGCALCQGFLFGRPVPIKEFEASLKKDPC
jgi:diguanylate cyclase (GGDEF)-like protein/PAS domain S-box-containing protein